MSKQLPTSFGALLRQLRTDAGLTQEELAEAASLSHRSVSDLERGINLTARKETARLLADALHLAGPAREEFVTAARGHALASRPASGGVAAATRTLPRDIASFTGREPELLTLMATAADTAGTAGVVGIHAIGGMAGIGKTTFAVHAAHQLAAKFPDGQIFLSMHGHTPGHTPVDPADGLASLLQIMGIPPQQIPPGLEARMGLWRDHLAGKQLLLLDLQLPRRTPAAAPITIGTAPECAPDLMSREDALGWMTAERLNLHAAASNAATGDRAGYAIAIAAALHSFLRGQGHWDQALILGQTVLRAARQAGDRMGEAITLAGMGDIECLTGDYPASGTHLAQALELYHDLGNRLGEAGALSTLGFTQSLAGHYPAAKASQEKALELYGRLGDRLGEANARKDLGILLSVTGDYPAAMVSQQKALELYRSLGNRLGEANALKDLGIVQEASGDDASATASLTRALELYRLIGNRPGRAGALDCLGKVQRATGNYQAAGTSLDQALELYRGLGDRLGEAEVLNSTGDLRLTMGYAGQAHACHQQALATAEEIGSRREQARALEGIGRCCLHDGDLGQGAGPLHQALAIYERIGSPGVKRVADVIRDRDL